MASADAESTDRRPAVFLDRDGTINREVDYLARPEDLELLPGAGRALADLASAGFLLCVVTNQSGIARGKFDEAMLARIHGRLREELTQEGVTLDWIGHCPHHPDQGTGAYRARCSCRKPSPGMYLEAHARLSIDLERSWCVGDALRDLEAGRRVFVRGLLVRTGKGAEQERIARERGLDVEVVDDLAAAARRIVQS